MPTVDERIAELTHDLWREIMAADGWRYGPYNEAARTHDALVPFRELPPPDRRQLLIAIRAESVADNLRRLVRYRRGDKRLLALEEMRVGLLVAPSYPPDGPPREVGRVESWEADEAGECLTMIVVRWSDGEITEHIPEENELRILKDRH